MGSGGYPSLNNGHQVTGISSGERVNDSRTVSGLCWCMVANKYSFLQVGSGEVVAHMTMFTYDVN